MNTRTIRRICTALLICLGAGWLYYWFRIDAFLNRAYIGTSWEYFNSFASNWRARNPSATQADFVLEARGLLFRLGLIGTLLTGATGILLSFRQEAMSKLFNQPASAFPLGLLRIVTFGTILTLFDFQSPLWYSRLPDILLSPPPGWKSLATLLPLDATLVSTTRAVFVISCITGLLGFFSRASAFIATVTGIYVLGIPQLFGKVIHYHHLLWFTALLSVSRSGAVLSLDSFWTKGAQPTPSLAFSRPIRFVWVLIALIYFFPGFWKITAEGLSWALSDNLKYRMHILWFANDGFSPLFRLDRYPVLYRSGGLATIIFEMSVLFTLPFPKWRHAAVGAALLFHASTSLFLNVHFFSLIPFLIFLLDIESITNRFGKWIASQPVYLIYNQKSSFQCRVAWTLSRMDLFSRLQLLPQDKISQISDISEHTIFVSNFSNETEALWCSNTPSASSWLKMLRIVPAALAITPLLLLYQKYKRIDVLSSFFAPIFSEKKWTTRLGTLLVIVNIGCGLGHVDSWPFSVYPTFAVQSDPTTTTIQVIPLREDGTAIDTLVTTRSSEDTGFAAPRLRGLTTSVLRAPAEEREDKIRALWSIWEREFLTLSTVHEVEFYKAVYWTDPDRSPPLLVRRQVLARLETLQRDS